MLSRTASRQALKGQCQRQSQPARLWTLRAACQHFPRRLHTEVPAARAGTPLRKQLKDEAKRKRLSNDGRADASQDAAAAAARLSRWELTVGIEIHAQLNTERKLFSAASTSASATPNSQVALFDVSIPGTQPQFQNATLLPALRAAIALNCEIQPWSAFDRKHYFYADQPTGYQITQYYAPYARGGYIQLEADDGITPEDGDAVTVGIQQIQMEQDTAKTLQQPPDVSLLDFNRVGYPLIEIITLPHIHSPQTAAACVRKIQHILLAVGAVTTGMELGGLRADVNVSVRPRTATGGKLGTRTEIKNLSSFKAIEDAIIAERNRQIDVLEADGVVQGETRGWTLGSTETRKLRSKEGEVDYRYMPDPDQGPVIIGPDLVDLVKKTLPMLPNEQTTLLTERYGLSMKDARTLVALDGGERLDYFFEALNALDKHEKQSSGSKELGRVVGNWVLHELGRLLTVSGAPFSPDRVPSSSLALIVQSLQHGQISGKSAKQLLQIVFESEDKDVEAIIKRENLTIRHLSDEEYRDIARGVVLANPEIAQKVRDGQKGKLQWLIGQMMRQSGGRVDAQRAAKALEPLL